MITASAQTNIITFTNNEGIVFTNARVVKIETDGVLFGLTNWQYTRVKFTNMPIALQTSFGFDLEKIRKTDEARQASFKAAANAAHDRAIAEAKAAQCDSIKQYEEEFHIYSFSKSDFPKTDGTRQACKEIVAELNGISKALEIGLSYNKFSDILTDKALAVEKIKDLRGESIPPEFLREVDGCIDAYTRSRDWWSKKIDNVEYPTIQALDQYFVRDYWSEADLCLICCSGIAESNTNAMARVVDKMAERIKDQQDAVKEGILERRGSFDPSVSDLTIEQISARLKTALSATNSPAN